ncbi:MAG: lysophospholipid acyltransferase family protein, partial [Planctomycetaceae bacterium]
MKRSRTLRHLAEYVVFRTVVCAIDALPTPVCVRLSRLLAFIVHRLLPRKWNRDHVARENIRTAFGDRYSEAEIDRMIYEMWVHLF